MSAPYRYGFTPSSVPPWLEVHKLERVVGGAKLTYLRRGQKVRVFDGRKELPIDSMTEKRILEAWPTTEDDPLSWWD